MSYQNLKEILDECIQLAIDDLVEAESERCYPDDMTEEAFNAITPEYAYDWAQDAIDARAVKEFLSQKVNANLLK